MQTSSIHQKIQLAAHDPTMGADQRQAYKLKHDAEDALQVVEEQRLEDVRLAAA